LVTLLPLPRCAAVSVGQLAYRIMPETVVKTAPEASVAGVCCRQDCVKANCVKAKNQKKVGKKNRTRGKP
jgi:hypothetical protein